MTAAAQSGGRLRAYLLFVLSLLYLFFARSFAHRAAEGFASQPWLPLVEQALLVFLLLVVYGALGFWVDRQLDPISQQGFPRRSGWLREVGLGLATGWALVVVCVLPMAFAGGIAVSFSAQGLNWSWLLADAAFFGCFSLAEEIAFRGYAFQCFVRAVGPFGAAVGFAAIYAIVERLIPGSTTASFAAALAFSFLLSAVYLRTRALWLSWGLNFAWKASQALIFGLSVEGISSHSPIVQSDPMGPFWLTGGSFGIDGSWFACFVLLAALPLAFRLTRDLDYRYNAPLIVPGGIPVDIDKAARAQHEAAMGNAAPAVPQLVQIGQPAPTAPAPGEGLHSERAADHS
jgi:uncharacterized protein